MCRAPSGEPVAPILDDFVAAAQTQATAPVPARKSSRRGRIPAAPGERRMCGVEGYDVRAGTSRSPTIGCASAWAPPASAPSTARGPVETRDAGQHIALPVL